MNKIFTQYVTALFIGFSALAFFPENAKAQTYKSPAKTRGARDIVKEIIDVVGLTPRFEMREAEIDNAAAVIMNGRRYILYNTRFLNQVNSASRTDWAAVSILAHEIGHHLNGHTLLKGGSNPTDELEADEFSGFVLRKMGASLTDAQAAMAVLSDEYETPTHPGRKSRLTAISNGWRNANSQMLAGNNSVSDKPVAIATQKRTPQLITSEEVEPTLDSRFILTKVTFKNAPREEFYITTYGNLVRVKNKQLEIIGKLAQTNNEQFPFVFKSDKIDPLFVSKTGKIYNRNGKELGWLS
ncbi:M48 family metalloprotease [Adhaeribacter sp. BT258]|uniref:M48 family metalloprotease n=1 Tax=Adhaeribacter terrigena TaxID=2793070 RepID=A0ABS1C4R9_9BACT|nr:M48 family metalloprotease [Adhaeribacter terrigena]MBK0404355.1 M48 family metalloprotease [Adhaeribacter terrigena]